MLLSCFHSDIGSMQLTDIGVEKFFSVKWPNLRKLDLGNAYSHSENNQLTDATINKLSELPWNELVSLHLGSRSPM